MKKPTIEVLVGNIATGKSTFCKRRAREGAIIIDHDAIIDALHAGQYTLFDRELIPLYHTIEDSMIRSALLIGKDIVIDRTNVERCKRVRYIDVAARFDVDCQAIVFPAREPSVQAEIRHVSDSRGVPYDTWLEVAIRFNDAFEFPVLEEGFSCISKYDRKLEQKILVEKRGQE